MTMQELKRDLDNAKANDINVTAPDIENFFEAYVDKKNQYFYNINSTVVFPDIDTTNESNFKFYSAAQYDTWPLISYKLYGTTRYMWLLLKLNRVKNACVKPFLNQAIMYISPNAVDKMMNYNG